jgi:hypothetical protein
VIKIAKEKTEMREGSPIKVLTIELDLEDVRQISKDLTIDQLKAALGEPLYNKVASMVKCKQ